MKALSWHIHFNCYSIFILNKKKLNHWLACFLSHKHIATFWRKAFQKGNHFHPLNIQSFLKNILFLISPYLFYFTSDMDWSSRNSTVFLNKKYLNRNLKKEIPWYSEETKSKVNISRFPFIFCCFIHISFIFLERIS